MPALAEKPEKVARVDPNAPWPMTTLGQVVSASTEKVDPLDQPNAPYIGLEHIERDVGTINGQGTAADVKSTKAVFRKGDLLYGKLRPYLNKVWIAQFDGVCSTDILVFPKCESVDNSFLKYRFMASDFVSFASENSNGVNLPRVNAKALARFPLWLPPLPEQRRIVAEIEQQFTRLDAGVTALRRTQANLKRYRAAVLKAACEGRLLSSDSSWPITPVGELAHIVTKGSSPNWQGFEYCDTGILFVRSQNVGWGNLDLSDVARLPVGFNEKEKKSVLKAGDVLLNIVGASIGRAAVATIEIEGGNVNQAVAVIRPITSRVSSKYLACYLLSDKAQALIHSQKVDVARANLSLEQIRNLPIPLPPLAEQTRIVAEVERRLSVIDDLESGVTANLQRASRLRQTILQSSFHTAPIFKEV